MDGKTSQVPEWLQTAGAAAALSSLSEAFPSEQYQPEVSNGQNIPQEILETPSPIQEQGSELVPENPDDAFAWLETLAGTKDVIEETPQIEPVASSGIEPDWLPEILQEEKLEKTVQSEPISEPKAEVQETTENALENEIPDWLKDLEPDSLPEEPAAVSEIRQETAGIVGDSSDALEKTVEAIEPVELLQTTNELTDNLEIPEWLTETPVESEKPPELKPFNVGGVAVSNEAEELPLPVNELDQIEKEVSAGVSAPLEVMGIELPTAVLENLPDSSMDVEKAPSAGIEIPVETPVELAQESVTAEIVTPLETPAELAQQSMTSEIEAPIEATSDFQQEQIEAVNPEKETLNPEIGPMMENADLLEELETDFGGAVLPAWMKAPEPEAAAGSGEDENVPEWLKEAEAEASAKGTSATDLPDWLQLLETQSEPTPEPTAETYIENPVEIPEITTPIEEASAWLETLEEKQSEVELELISEESLANPPEWVKDQAVEPVVESETVIENEAEEGSAVEVVSGDLPDWLKDLESERASETEIMTSSGEEIVDLSTAAEEGISQTGEPVNEWVQELPGSSIARDETPELIGESPVEDTQPVTVAPIPEAEEIPEPAYEVPLEAQPIIDHARTALHAGNLQDALADYLALIKQNQALDVTIQDLKDALYQYPADIDLWQTLGDAFAHSNHLQDALDSYAKAEELLR